MSSWNVKPQISNLKDQNLILISELGVSKPVGTPPQQVFVRGKKTSENWTNKSNQYNCPIIVRCYRIETPGFEKKIFSLFIFVTYLSTESIFFLSLLFPHFFSTVIFNLIFPQKLWGIFRSQFLKSALNSKARISIPWRQWKKKYRDVRFPMNLFSHYSRGKYPNRMEPHMQQLSQEVCIAVVILIWNSILFKFGNSFLTGNALIGLLVGFFLIFIAWNGISRLMDIQTSDRLGSKDPRDCLV